MPVEESLLFDPRPLTKEIGVMDKDGRRSFERLPSTVVPINHA